MKISEYQDDCVRTANISEDKTLTLCNWVMSLNEEAGEVAGTVKKPIFHGHDFEPDLTIEEVGDVLFYATMICNELGYTLEECMTRNMIKRRKRYRDGFSVEESRNREEYTIDKRLKLNSEYGKFLSYESNEMTELTENDLAKFKAEWEKANNDPLDRPKIILASTYGKFGDKGKTEFDRRLKDGEG